MAASRGSQQVISKTSEHQRRFERITTTFPSRRRPLRGLGCAGGGVPAVREIIAKS